jgi:hypothetical protein
VISRNAVLWVFCTSVVQHGAAALGTGLQAAGTISHHSKTGAWKCGKQNPFPTPPPPDDDYGQLSNEVLHFSDPPHDDALCASLAFHLHQVGQGTCTPKLLKMFGTQWKRAARVGRPMDSAVKCECKRSDATTRSSAEVVNHAGKGASTTAVVRCNLTRPACLRAESRRPYSQDP